MVQIVTLELPGGVVRWLCAALNSGPPAHEVITVRVPTEKVGSVDLFLGQVGAQGSTCLPPLRFLGAQQAEAESLNPNADHNIVIRYRETAHWVDFFVKPFSSICSVAVPHPLRCSGEPESMPRPFNTWLQHTRAAEINWSSLEAETRRVSAVWRRDAFSGMKQLPKSSHAEYVEAGLATDPLHTPNSIDATFLRPYLLPLLRMKGRSVLLVLGVDGNTKMPTGILLDPLSTAADTNKHANRDFYPGFWEAAVYARELGELLERRLGGAWPPLPRPAAPWIVVTIQETSFRHGRYVVTVRVDWPEGSVSNRSALLPHDARLVYLDGNMRLVEEANAAVWCRVHSVWTDGLEAALTTESYRRVVYGPQEIISRLGFFLFETHFAKSVEERLSKETKKSLRAMLEPGVDGWILVADCSERLFRFLAYEIPDGDCLKVILAYTKFSDFSDLFRSASISLGDSFDVIAAVNLKYLGPPPHQDATERLPPDFQGSLIPCASSGTSIDDLADEVKDQIRLWVVDSSTPPPSSVVGALVWWKSHERLLNVVRTRVSKKSYGVVVVAQHHRKAGVTAMVRMVAAAAKLKRTVVCSPGDVNLLLTQTCPTIAIVEDCSMQDIAELRALSWASPLVVIATHRTSGRQQFISGFVADPFVPKDAVPDVIAWFTQLYPASSAALASLEGRILEHNQREDFHLLTFLMTAVTSVPANVTTWVTAQWEAIDPDQRKVPLLIAAWTYLFNRPYPGRCVTRSCQDLPHASLRPASVLSCPRSVDHGDYEVWHPWLAHEMLVAAGYDVSSSLEDTLRLLSTIGADTRNLIKEEDLVRMVAGPDERARTRTMQLLLYLWNQEGGTSQAGEKISATLLNLAAPLPSDSPMHVRIYVQLSTLARNVNKSCLRETAQEWASKACEHAEGTNANLSPLAQSCYGEALAANGHYGRALEAFERTSTPMTARVASRFAAVSDMYLEDLSHHLSATAKDLTEAKRDSALQLAEADIPQPESLSMQKWQETWKYG